MPRARRSRDYQTNVFINCPFDNAYERLFRCVVFTTIHCGFRARCAKEIDDSSQIRIEKILGIIEECRLSIHDLSRTELDAETRLPRFNMPLELGLFLGAKRFGDRLQSRKVCLIFDRRRDRYQKFISDIAGQDIRAHLRDETTLISATRDWLSNYSRRQLPGGGHIARRYGKFKSELRPLCRTLRLQVRNLTFNDFNNIATGWLIDRPAPAD